MKIKLLLTFQCNFLMTLCVIMWLQCLPCILLSINSECILSHLRMVENIIKMVVLQDALPIILTVDFTHKAQIKGHPMYTKICISEPGDYLEAKCKQENVVDKYVAGLIKGCGHYGKTIFLYLWSNTKVKCRTKLAGDLTLIVARVNKFPALYIPQGQEILKEQFGLLKKEW